MANLAQINIRFAANLREFSTQMQSVQREFQKVGSQMQDIGKAMSVAISLPLAAAGVAAYNMAADFEDALGATDQIFKEASDAVQQWSSQLPTYFGIAKKEALEYSNMMGSMLQNIGGLTEQEASQQSAKLIELAGDLTAMYGGTTADAVRALTGALKGNNTMLDNYGMAANDALVKAKAFEMGLITQGSEMTLAAKQAATLALIYEQTGAAQGQAAREADGSSGSMRAFRTELTNLTTELGEHLLPIITPFIQKLRDVMANFREMDPETKKIVVVVGGLAAALGPLLVALGGIVSAAPLVISGIASIGTVFTALTGPIGLVAAAIGGLIYLIIKNWSSVKKTLIDTANYFIDLYNESLLVRAGVETIIGVFKTMGNTIKLVFDVAGTILKNFWNNLKNMASSIGSLLKAFITGDFKAIPGILAEGFRKGFEDSKKSLVDFRSDFMQFNNDMKDTVSTALRNSLQKKYKLLGQDVDTEEVKKKIETDVETAINAGVDGFNKDGKKIKIEVEPVKGSVGYFDKLISQLEQAQKNTSTDNETFNVFQSKIDELKKLRDEIAALGNVEGSEEWYQNRLSLMDEELKKIPYMTEAYEKAKHARDLFEKQSEDAKNPNLIGSQDWYESEIKMMQKSLSFLEQNTQAYKDLVQQIEIFKETKELAFIAEEPEQGTVDWYNYHINQLKELRTQTGITIEEYNRLGQEISMLETTFKLEVEGVEEIKEATNEIKTLQAVASGSQTIISEAFSAMSQSIAADLGEARNGFEKFGQALIQNTIKAIGTALAQSTANAILAASGDAAKIPFGTFLMPALIGGAVASVAAAFAGIPKFADGGIVYGPTVGLMGEYAGAANNPEVIAPLNKLKDLINPAATDHRPVNVVLSGGFDVSGETLKLVLDRTERRKFRTG